MERLREHHLPLPASALWAARRVAASVVVGCIVGVLPAPARAVLDADDSVSRFVNDWKSAREETARTRSVERLRGFYHPNYVNRQSRRGLATEMAIALRRGKSAGNLTIRVGTVRTEIISGDRLRAVFPIEVETTGYSSDGTKTLTLAKTHDGWRIIDESFSEDPNGIRAFRRAIETKVGLWPFPSGGRLGDGLSSGAKLKRGVYSMFAGCGESGYKFKCRVTRVERLGQGEFRTTARCTGAEWTDGHPDKDDYHRKKKGWRCWGGGTRSTGCPLERNLDCKEFHDRFTKGAKARCAPESKHGAEIAWEQHWSPKRASKR